MFLADMAHAETISIDDAIIVLIDISRLEDALGKADCLLPAIIPEGINERVLRSGGPRSETQGVIEASTARCSASRGE